VCEDCGRGYVAKSVRSKFCSDLCRVRASRRSGKVGQAKAAAAPKAPKTKGAKAAAAEVPQLPKKPPPPTYDALAEQVTATLTSMKAYDTIAGKAALRVAQQIDRGGDSGSAVATLSTQLMRLVEQAKVEAAPLNRDKADDLIDKVNNKLLRLLG
jgi:hypothetical protein